MTFAIAIGFVLLWLALYGISEKNLNETVTQSRLSHVVKASPFLLNSEKSSFASSLQLEWKNDTWIKGDGTPLAEEINPTNLSIISSNAPLFLYLQGAPEGLALRKLKDIFVNYLKKEDLVVLCSSDSTLKELRGLVPLWSYGSGQTFLARLLFFSSMKLLGLLTIPGDVLHVQDVRKIDAKEAESILHFARKKNKIVIFESKNIGFAKNKNGIGFLPSSPAEPIPETAR